MNFWELWMFALNITFILGGIAIFSFNLIKLFTTKDKTIKSMSLFSLFLLIPLTFLFYKGDIRVLIAVFVPYCFIGILLLFVSDIVFNETQSRVLVLKKWAIYSFKVIVLFVLISLFCLIAPIYIN